MKSLLIVLCLSLFACVAPSTESEAGATCDETPGVMVGAAAVDAVHTREFDDWLAQRCPPDHRVEVRARDTGDVLVSSPCTEALDVALADDGARAKIVEEFQARMRLSNGGAINEELGEAQQRGILGTVIGFIAGALISRQCEHQHVRWQECTAAQVPIAILTFVIPF